MSWPELTQRPRPEPTSTLAYGNDPNQLAELWAPSTPGPHPVVIMIHGGCWQAKVATHSLMAYAAHDLQRRGIAVWNIEYRGIDQPGGGYPGTFQDVAAAMDRLAAAAPDTHLDLSRVVLLGHSAGGQLALWAAGRPRLPATSPLAGASAIKVLGVVDIAGLPDLKHDTATACGAEAPATLAGPPSPARPDVYADTSPIRLLPLGVPQVVIHGAQDVTVRPAVGDAYVQAARAAGDRVAFQSPPGAHVEEITPGQRAWAASVQAVQRLLRGEPVG